MTDAELFAIIRPIIIKATGVPECILANPNAPSPNGAYATVQIRQSVSQRGQANIHRKNIVQDGGWIGVETTVKAQIIAAMSINFWRGEATMYAELLRECNKLPTVSAMLRAGKIGWGGADAVNNLNALQANNWEQRAQVTVRLWYETTNSDVINAIYSASVAVEKEDGTLIETIDISVDSP